ncbi:MAG: DUF3078 domain-containing protein [Prevotella sp.]
MKTIYLSLLFLCFGLIETVAQTPIRKSGKIAEPDSVSAIKNMYVDSLRIFRENQMLQGLRDDSLGVVHQIDGKYSRLFTPFTFYYDIVDDLFALDTDSVPDGVGQTLLDVYVNRPDLVWGTQGMLEQAGTIITPEPEMITPETDIIEKVSPVADDLDVESMGIVLKRPNFWSFSGEYNLQLNQNTYSGNWFKGGENSLNMTHTLNINANYNNKRRFSFSNNLYMSLGLSKVESEKEHKFRIGNNDLRYTGTINYQAIKNWSYSFQTIAFTSLMRRYDNNSNNVSTDFLSPLKLELTVGMNYNINWFKGKISGSAHLAPLGYHFTYVGRDALVSRYGVKQGKHIEDNFGPSFNANLSWRIMKNISWRTRIWCTTSYEYFLFENENWINFNVNKFINCELYFYPRFDDGVRRDEHHAYWQFKETFSLGFKYSF